MRRSKSCHDLSRGTVGLVLLALGCSQPAPELDPEDPSTSTERLRWHVRGRQRVPCDDPRAAKDPGPRGGPPGAGGPIATLGDDEKAFFAAARAVFQEVASVSGSLPGEPAVGLGPQFNGNSCVMCHQQPAIGGTSPAPFSPQNPIPNPQIALATLHGADNPIPSFLRPDGPAREARFITTGDANDPLDGTVHELFSIRGRVDAAGCDQAPPDFAAQLAAGNVSFRIPTPLFGLGLVENTPDEALEANLAASSARKASFGIVGRLNRSGNTQTAMRFGWKAQNPTLLVFAGEASVIELGITNENFATERRAEPGCIFNPTPEDPTRVTSSAPAVTIDSNVTNFAGFMRFAAPPTPAALSSSAQDGEKAFEAVGCTLCHSTTLKSAASPFAGMSDVEFHPYSDFALHHMGSTLADGIRQGLAGPDEFRTAPLWGVGQRLFFLHDGRTSDLLEAIVAHRSPGRDCVMSDDFERFQVNGVRFAPFVDSRSCGSEANRSIDAFDALPREGRQAIVDFLRAL